MRNLAEPALERVAPTRQKLQAGYLEALRVLRDEGQFPRVIPPLEAPSVTSLADELATASGAVTRVDAEALRVAVRAYQALEAVQRNETYLDERYAQVRFNDGVQHRSGFIYYVNRASGNEPVAIEHVRSALEIM